MKKSLLILLITSSLFIVGCSSKSTETKPTETNKVNQEVTQEIKEEAQEIEEEAKEEAQEDKIKVKVNEIKLVDFKIKKPDSIGTIYMETKFKNNSKENIKGITYIYEIDGERMYLSNYDTLKPGDTSTISDTFGPKSGKKEDMKLLAVSITVINKDGSQTFIDYDAVLDFYEQLN